MQPGGWQQRLCKDFVVERRQMLVDVRVGGHVMEVESSPVPGNAFDEEESEMWGGAFGGNEMLLVDSAGGAGWVVGQLGVADFAADVQYGRGGVEGAEQGDGRGPQFFSGGFSEPCELSGFKCRCPDCADINPIEFYECYMCCEGVDDEWGGWRVVEREAHQVVVANGECCEGGRGRVPRQSVRTGGGEGGVVSAWGLGMEGEECELWEEVRVTDEEGGVEEDMGTEVWAGTGPQAGQDASQVVDSKAEQEAGGTVVPMQMTRGGVGEGGFVAPKPWPRALASVVEVGVRGAMGWAVMVWTCTCPTCGPVNFRCMHFRCPNAGPMQMVQTGGGEGEFVAMEAGRGPGQDVSQGMELGQSRREG